MNVTVYTTPSCGQCVTTKAHLKRAGIPFAEVNVTKDEAAREELIYRGFTTMPVVIAEYGGREHSWSAYRPTLIEALIAHRDHNKENK